jgi:phage terminase small subunit
MKKARKPQEMPAKHRLFVADFLVTRNAAESYRNVYGCSSPTAETNGPRLRRSARVSAAIDEKLREVEKRAVLDVERIDAELACAVHFDPADLRDPETGATLPVHRWPEHARRALSGFEEEAIFENVETGERDARGKAVKARVQVGVVRKFKWQDKTAAQRLAYQRKGALVEKHEHTVTPAEDISDEEWEALAKLRHEVRGRRSDAS